VVEGMGLEGGVWHTNNAQPGATAPTAATHSLPADVDVSVSVSAEWYGQSGRGEGVQWRLGFRYT